MRRTARDATVSRTPRSWLHEVHPSVEHDTDLVQGTRRRAGHHVLENEKIERTRRRGNRTA